MFTCHTVKDVPSNVAYWAEKENCQTEDSESTQQYEHIIHRDEFDLFRLLNGILLNF